MAERYAGILLCHEIAESREDIPYGRTFLPGRRPEHRALFACDQRSDRGHLGPRPVQEDHRYAGPRALSLTMRSWRDIGGSSTRDPKRLQRIFPEGGLVRIERTRLVGYERFRAYRDAIVDLYLGSHGRMILAVRSGRECRQWKTAGPLEQNSILLFTIACFRRAAQRGRPC